MDASSAPLADYFWIAGIEDISYHDNDLDPRPLSSLQLNDTIREDAENEASDTHTQTPTKDTARHSRRSSINRISRIPSNENNRFSIQTLGEENEGTRSNRSSATIRAVPPINGGSGGDESPFSPIDPAPSEGSSATNGGGQGVGFTGLPDFDFDKALMKFAAEREIFLDDLSFTAGAKLQARPPMVNNPRAERIKAEEGELSGRMSPLKSIKGSIRRKISFRDMNSVKRQTAPPRVRPGKSPRSKTVPTDHGCGAIC